jgi:hypothetical protein
MHAELGAAEGHSMLGAGRAGQPEALAVGAQLLGQTFDRATNALSPVACSSLARGASLSARRGLAPVRAKRSGSGACNVAAQSADHAQRVVVGDTRQRPQQLGKSLRQIGHGAFDVAVTATHAGPSD